MKLEKKTAQNAGDLVIAYMKYLKAVPALNTRRIFKAWNTLSGAQQYTLGLFFKDGTLYVKLSSSVARTFLKSQCAAIKERINNALKEDELFIQDDPKVGFVEKIVLK